MSAVAKRYAEAYLGSAADHQALDAVGEDISVLWGLLRDSDEFAGFVANPLLSQELQNTCLDKLFSGKVSQVTLNLLRLLVQRERLASLPSILGKALELWREQRGILSVLVTAAQELSGDQKSALEKKLAARTGKTIELSCGVNPALIGGFQLLINGVVEDYSLAATLHTFKQNVLNA